MISRGWIALQRCRGNDEHARKSIVVWRYLVGAVSQAVFSTQLSLPSAIACQQPSARAPDGRRHLRFTAGASGYTDGSPPPLLWSAAFTSSRFPASIGIMPHGRPP